MRITGLADGLYEWWPATGELRLLRAGRFLADVQQGFFYPQTVTRAAACNLALFLVLDYPAVLRECGPRWLRVSQLEVGGIAQAAALAMTAHEAFLRPCRSFSAGRIAELAGLGAGVTVADLCLGGRSRYADLLLDLRPRPLR